jgi:hypothetical protein
VTTDDVNHPDHYCQGTVECIEALESALGHDGFVGYCIGNVIKYAWRYRQKGGVNDLKKAKWYLNRVLERLEQADPNNEVER